MFFHHTENRRTYPVIFYQSFLVKKNSVLFLNIFLCAFPDIRYKTVEGNAKWISEMFFSYLIHYQKNWRQYAT